MNTIKQLKQLIANDDHPSCDRVREWQQELDKLEVKQDMEEKRYCLAHPVGFVGMMLDKTWFNQCTTGKYLEKRGRYEKCEIHSNKESLLKNNSK